METRADTVKAVVYALLVHVLVLLLAFSGLFWWQTGKPVRAAGEPIEAVFVDLAALAPPAPPRPAPRPAPPPPPPPPQQPEPPTDLQADDTVDQQRIDQQALLRAEEEAREQEERRRRAEQVLLEEQERQRAEEERRREREQQQQREREQREQQQREAAERAAAEAAAREAAEREAAATAAQAGQRGEDESLLARYGAAITQAVHRRWRMPENSPRVVCTMQIVQVRGGTILSAPRIRPCNADEQARATLERAVLAAEPLPYEGFESVFRREIQLTFCHPQDLQECTQ